jgi:hypothetical protein
MKRLNYYLFLILICMGCQPKKIEPIADILGRKWKAQMIREGNQVVFNLGSNQNIKAGYANYRLDLSSPAQAILRDIDNRTLTGTWAVSTDNQRLIIENLNPKPTGTIGTIEFYIKEPPTQEALKIERTDESRKTGNTLNYYQLIPE